MNAALLETINRTCEARVGYGLPPVELVSSGIPQLDAVMGGIPRGGSWRSTAGRVAARLMYGEGLAA